MSGFGKFSTIRYRFRRGGTRHPGFIVCHVQPLPPPPSILRFSQGFTWCREIKLVHRWSGLQRRILETVPLLGITEREKMVLESVSGIVAQLHRFHPSSSRLWSIDALSIFPLRKSIIETWEISKLYFFRIPSRDARSDLFPSSLEHCILARGKSNSNCYRGNKFTLFEFGLEV